MVDDIKRIALYDSNYRTRLFHNGHRTLLEFVLLSVRIARLLLLLVPNSSWAL